MISSITEMQYHTFKTNEHRLCNRHSDSDPQRLSEGKEKKKSEKKIIQCRAWTDWWYIVFGASVC